MKERAAFLAPLGELKFADAGTTGSFTGYAAVFGNVDLGGDLIVKGAFRETLREAERSGIWPGMLMQHGGALGSDLPVGVWEKIEEDDKGLRVRGRLADTERGREAYALLKMQPRPALDGLSIGYFAKEFAYGTKPGEPRRTLKKIDLFEISLVQRPMNQLARVTGVKTLADLSPGAVERILRQAGLSRGDARAIVAGGFKAARATGATAPTLAALDGLLGSIKSATATLDREQDRRIGRRTD